MSVEITYSKLLNKYLCKLKKEGFVSEIKFAIAALNDWLCFFNISEDDVISEEFKEADFSKRLSKYSRYFRRHELDILQVFKKEDHLKQINLFFLGLE